MFMLIKKKNERFLPNYLFTINGYLQDKNNLVFIIYLGWTVMIVSGC